MGKINHLEDLGVDGIIIL